MRGPSLISGYLDALASQLPGPVVEELAGGLEDTYRRHLGLASEAARAAVAEFGDPGLIAAEFARAHPARRAARRLLAAGPVVGACWAVALVTGRAWTWPVPVGTAGCVGIAALDGFMIIGVLAADPAARWAVAVAAAASAARLGLSVRLLRPVLASG